MGRRECVCRWGDGVRSKIWMLGLKVLGSGTLTVMLVVLSARDARASGGGALQGLANVGAVGAAGASAGGGLGCGLDVVGAAGVAVGRDGGGSWLDLAVCAGVGLGMLGLGSLETSGGGGGTLWWRFQRRSVRL